MANNLKAKFKKPDPDNVIPSFIKKTYDILEERKFPDIVDWNEEGTAIVILKPIEFSEKVLPAYFKHNNLTSFVRQLNMYNFHKRRTQEIDHIYYHELFQRGKKHLLKEIKRKNNEHFLSLQKTIDTLESLQSSQDNMGIAHENIVLKKLNREALLRIDTLEKKIKDLTIQNQALWTQICNQNEREDLLKQLLANTMKIANISPSQLPLLAQADSNLMSLNNMASDNDLLSKSLFSQGLMSNLQQSGSLNGTSPRTNLLNVNEFLKRGDSSVSDPKENSLPLANLMNLLNNTTPLELTKDNSAESRVLQPLPPSSNYITPLRDNNTINPSQLPYWNLEAEYLKALANSDQRFNTLPGSENKGSVLGKRSLDLDKVQEDTVSKLVHQDSTNSDNSLFGQRRGFGMGFTPFEGENGSFEACRDRKRKEQDMRGLGDLLGFGVN